MTSRVRVSARSRPSPPLYPHFNRPSGFWPCVKSCLLGGSDKYWILRHSRYVRVFNIWFVTLHLCTINLLKLSLCVESHFIFILIIFPQGCPRGVMVKAMDCGIVVSEFVLQSRYYVHFRANTLGKGMNPLILPAMG